MHVIIVSVLALLANRGLVATGPPDFRELTGNPWQDMDYGPFLSAAIEVDPDNIACKGVAPYRTITANCLALSPCG